MALKSPVLHPLVLLTPPGGLPPGEAVPLLGRPPLAAAPAMALAPAAMFLLSTRLEKGIKLQPRQRVNMHPSPSLHQQCGGSLY